MKEQKTKGVILSKTNFGENDLIFDLLTEKGERLSFFVRGGRKVKNRFSGAIQLGAFVKTTFSTGKNFNYPKEIEIDSLNRYDFYSKSIKAMNFFADIILITKLISRDFESAQIFNSVENIFRKAQDGEELELIYANFLNVILTEVGYETELKCSTSGELIAEKEFYYHPESNRVFKKENRPKSLDLPLISKDNIFTKNYLQKLFYQNISHSIRLKF